MMSTMLRVFTSFHVAIMGSHSEFIKNAYFFFLVENASIRTIFKDSVQGFRTFQYSPPPPHLPQNIQVQLGYAPRFEK